MREEIRRIVAFLCAFCLIVSGEGRLSLTALADVIHPAFAAYAAAGTGHDSVRAIDTAGDARIDDAAAADAAADTGTGHDEDSAAETVLSENVLTAEWDIYHVKVRYGKEPDIPSDARLVVREVTEKNNPNYADYISVGADTAGVEIGSVGIAKAFDISLRSDETGEEYQPSSDMKVEISIPSYYVSDDMQVDVVHFAEKQDGTTKDDLTENKKDEANDGQERGIDDAVISALDSIPKLMDVDLVNNTAAFTTDGFSVFVVLGYTVDFHWGDYTYNMTGGNTLSLKELVARLHMVDVDDPAVLDAKIAALDEAMADHPTVIPKNDGEETELEQEVVPAAVKPVWPREIEAFVAGVASVEFTDPELGRVTKVDSEIAVGDLVESLGLVNQFSAEMTDYQIEAAMKKVLTPEDWAFISLKPFLTEEKLTITMKNGDVYEIGVTDAQGYVNYTYRNPTVNIKTGDTVTSHASNLNFALTNNGLARVTGKNVNTAGTYYYIPDKIEYPAGSGTYYLVNDIANLTPAAINGRHVVFDDDLCLRMLDAEQTSLEPVVDRILASMMVSSGLAKESDLTEADWATENANPKGLTDARVDELAQANGFVVGAKNEDNGNLFELFKRAQYDAENNKVTIELKYFQKMKRDFPLDFIFIYDDSGTMASAAYNHTEQKDKNNANIRYAASQSVWCRIALQVILKGIMDQQDNGYNIRMAPIAFASNAFYTKDTFYDTYVKAKEAIGEIYTSGGTEHYKAIEDALDLATYSINHDHRNPIVVYLSDFHSNANTRRAKEAAVRLRALKNGDENIQVYTIHMFEPNFRYDRNIATDSNHMYILNDTRPVSDLLTIFDTITKDAIGYFIGKGLSVQDGIDANMNAIADDITMQGDANIVKNGNTAKWTFSDDTTRRKAGVIYSQNIELQLRDDVVFSPSLPSNTTCKVVSTTDDDDGNEHDTIVNEINDQPLPKKELKMILGLIDETGVKTNNVIADAQFELYRGSSATGTPVWTGTTASMTDSSRYVGEISIPYTSAPFNPGETYVLKQVSTDENIAIQPEPGTWTLIVGSDYLISSTAGGDKTPAMTVTKGEFHIWNDAKANTMTPLVPVVVKKTWNDISPSNDTDSINFTVLGNLPGGGTVELPSFSESDRTKPNFEELYTTNELKKSEGWQKVVYVPAFIVDTESGDKTVFFDTANNAYTNGYSVKENSVNVTAPDGEWAVSVDNTGRTTPSSYTYYTYEGQEGIFDVTASSWTTYGYLELDFADTNDENSVYNNDSMFIKEAKPKLIGSTTADFWITYTDNSGSTGEALLHITFNSIDINGYIRFHNVKLPSNWKSVTFTRVDVNGFTVHNSEANKSYLEQYPKFATGSHLEDHTNRNVVSQSLKREEHVTPVPHTGTNLARQILQITNTFTSMYTIKFGTQWVDNSIDEIGNSAVTPAIAARHATRDYIDAVTYTVYDGSGNPVGDPVTVEKGDTMDYPAAPGTVRLPAGTYTVRQTSYTLANGEVVRTKAPEGNQTDTFQFAAYSVTNDQDSASGGAYTVTVGSGTTAPIEVKFTNTRIEFETVVETKWLPTGHTLQYNGDVPYDLSYTTLKLDGTSYTAEKQVIHGTNTAAGNWTAAHSAIPSHSINGQATICNVDSTTLEALAEKYRTEVKSKIENGNYVFTIINTLRQGDIILHKDWEYEHNETSVTVLVKGYGLSEADGYVLPANYEAFNSGAEGGILVTLNEENSWTHILKGYKGQNYTVEEIAPSGDIAQYLVRTDADAEPTFEAPVSLENLREEGTEVIITNFRPICKIVDENGVEHPFRLLNSAVTYARDHRTTLTMNADNSVKIQMVVDYVIPETDTVTINQATDNIIFTTAGASGGVYNFVDTKEGKTAADEGKAILTRGFTGDSLFKVASEADAKLGFENIILDGDKDNYRCSGDGGLVSASTGSISIKNETVVRNFKASGNGGAVYMSSGALRIGDVDFIDCAANGTGTNGGKGGAICIEGTVNAVEDGMVIDGHSSLTLKKAGDPKDGGTLTEAEADELNKTDGRGASANAVNGGGIYVGAGASFTFTGGELIKCKASANGGAIYNAGRLIMAEKDEADSHELINGSIEYCSAISTDSAKGNGGAIYNAAGGTVDMTGGYLEHCIASGNGGGIYTESTATQTVAEKTVGAVNMHTEGDKPGVISDCEAANGGGVYVKAGGLDMTGGEIRNCKAFAPKNSNGEVIVRIDSNTFETICVSGKGGGVYNLGNVILATAADYPGKIDSCSADFAGGGIYTTGTGSMSIIGGEMDDNRAGYYGGAIYDDTIREESPTADLTIKGVVIRGHVNLDKDIANARNGGAIYAANGNLELIDNGSGDSAVHVQIYDCTASEQGGAIYHIYNQHKHKNIAGGRKTSLTMINAIIDGHDQLADETPNADYGGAIYVFNGCNESLSGHEGHNSVDHDPPKFSQYQGPKIIISGGKIADCTADINGGAIYCDSPVQGKGTNTISIQDGAVINGHESLAAEVWNANGNDTTSNANQTNLGGGAIYFKRGTLRVGRNGDTSRTKIINCTAKHYGGAIFGLPMGTNIDEEGESYTAKLENCLIDGHRSDSGTMAAAPEQANAGIGGGAVCMKMSTVTIENSKLKNLRAPYGAAILGRTNDAGTQASKITIDNSTIEYNIATADYGGAINALSGEAIEDAGIKPVSGNEVCRFYLERDSVIYNNFGIGALASQQKNLVLTRHKSEAGGEVGETNAIINTTANGLGENAHIGIYVTGNDGMDGGPESEPYELHGGYEDDFGTYYNNAAGKANLYKLINDRNGMYGAVCTLTYGNHTTNKGHNKSNYIIRWQSYLCKLTDGSGNLLFITKPGGWAGTRVVDEITYYPAVFMTLKEAFNAMKGFDADGTTELKLYKADASEYKTNKDIQLHMLRNYEQPGSDRPTFDANRKVTFTTANKQASLNVGYYDIGDVYVYSKGSFANADDTRATILRGDNGTAGDASMLTIPDSAPTGLSLTLRNIIFDGNNYTHTGPGGIINARMGDLTVTTGSILRNAIATDKGGAIEKINGNFIMDGNAQVVNCAAQHGGGVHLEALTKCEIGGSDVMITGSKANNGCGGGIFIHSSPAVFKDKLTIRDCHADAKGGGVNIGWGDASLTVEGENVKILNCDAKKEQEGQSSDGGGGLNIETGRNVSFGKLTISGCYTDGKGGAVRLEENATMTMNDGTIEKNKVLAGGEGAGIYVSQGSTLKLSGSPGFGSGSDANTAALDGYSTKENGGEAYGSNDVRQDIFLKGYLGQRNGNPIPATSVVVTGAFADTVAESSIYVWAEKPAGDEEDNHYEQLKQFAVFDAALVRDDEKLTLTEEQTARVYKAFRNAQDDETTNNGTGEWLSGSEGDEPGYIYWSGIYGKRKVILRKVNSGFESLAGAHFNVYKGNSSRVFVLKDKAAGTRETLGKYTDEHGVEIDPLVSLNSGVFWIGVLPYGTYYLNETAAPTAAAYRANKNKWFCLIVDEKGVWMSQAGYNASDKTEAQNKASALADVTAVRTAAVGS